MTIVVRTVDRWGQPAVLDERCWLDHVVSRRRYFSGHAQSCVADVIADPECVTRDADFADSECFNRGSPLPAPYARFLVKVVVAFHPGSNEVATVGNVITVHLATRMKPRETIKWKN